MKHLVGTFRPIPKKNNFNHMDTGEGSYLKLLDDILKEGDPREDRTGIGTLSLFGVDLRFDLSSGRFPLLTTKKVFFRGVVEELLWMLRGETDAKILHDKGVKIWDGNSTDTSYLERTGNPPYSIGPGYGFQLRNFGGSYGDESKESLEGVDQLKRVLHQLSHDRTSRRIMWTYCNPLQEHMMCLPPCHYSYQYYVKNNTLHCLMTQRSADIFLGTPFNIASTALLVHILAYVSGLRVGEIKISMGDAHIYKNHVEQSRLQCSRIPYPFPTLSITKVIAKDSSLDDKINFIESLTFTDFQLTDYKHHGTIKAKMAV